MKGRIIKGIAGFYYVLSKGKLYECRAKGLFRKQEIKPLVGDYAEFEILDETDSTGNIIDILPRKNELIRPAAANIDVVLAVLAILEPKPQLCLLDKYLISIKMQGVDTAILWNKNDLSPELPEYVEIYKKVGYKTMVTSASKGYGIDILKNFLQGKTTLFAGPSGAGKSSLTNRIFPEAAMQTGTISRKIERGRHTTRHSEVFILDEETCIFDTPGFTSVALDSLDKEELWKYYPEFEELDKKCRFSICSHISEPDCAVKEALENNIISRLRYDNYVKLYNELANKRKEKSRQL